MTGQGNGAVERFLEKAARDLRSARILLNDEDADGAGNRSFYAMFHAATAALASRNEACGTHAGLIGRFSALFVQTGLVPRELGRAFNMAEKVRLEADYSRGGLSMHAAEVMLADAERFLAAVSALLVPPS